MAQLRKFSVILFSVGFILLAVAGIFIQGALCAQNSDGTSASGSWLTGNEKTIDLPERALLSRHRHVEPSGAKNIQGPKPVDGPGILVGDFDQNSQRARHIRISQRQPGEPLYGHDPMAETQEFSLPEKQPSGPIPPATDGQGRIRKHVRQPGEPLYGHDPMSETQEFSLPEKQPSGSTPPATDGRQRIRSHVREPGEPLYGHDPMSETQEFSLPEKQPSGSTPPATDGRERIRKRVREPGETIYGHDPNAVTQEIPVQKPAQEPTYTTPGGRRAYGHDPNAVTQEVPVQKPSQGPTSTTPGGRRTYGHDPNAVTQEVPVQKPPQGTPGTGRPTGPGTGSLGTQVITLALTTEEILRCKEEGLTSDQCATRLITGAAEGAGITAAAVLTGTMPVVVVVGTVAMTVKGVHDAVAIMYAGGSYVGARMEEEQRKQERRHQQDLNRPYLEEMTAAERNTIVADLGPVAEAVSLACEKLKGMAGVASVSGNSAREALATMPSAAEIASVQQAAAACERAADLKTRLSALGDRVQGYASQVSAAFQQLDARAQTCATTEDAVRLQQGWDACVGLSRGIGQLCAEARGLGQQLKGLETQAAAAKATAARAQAAKDRTVGFAGRAADSYANFENEYNRATGLNAELQSRSEQALIRIDRLRKAFRIKPEDEAYFVALKDTVSSYRGRACPVDALKKQYDEGVAVAANARLDAENRVAGLSQASSGLALCDGAAPDSVIAQVDAAERDAGSHLVVNSDIPGKAALCLGNAQGSTAPGPAGATSGGSDGFSSRGGEDVAANGSTPTDGAGGSQAGADGFSSRGGEDTVPAGGGSPPWSGGYAGAGGFSPGGGDNRRPPVYDGGRPQQGPGSFSPPPYMHGQSPGDMTTADAQRQQYQQGMQDVLDNLSNTLKDMQRGSSGGARTPNYPQPNKPPPVYTGPPMPYGAGTSGGIKYPQQTPGQVTSRSTTPPGGQASSGSAAPSSGGQRVSPDDCLYRFCPMCRQSIDILNIAASPQCQACKSEKKAQIDACMAGGRSSGGGAATAPSGAGSSSWWYDPRGQPNPKDWCAHQKYQPSLRNYEYTIGKCANEAFNIDRRRIYGPDTYEGCKGWLIKRGYWKNIGK